ncbi:MAG: T9SS type B sorting domain-containing protein [Flavobacteriaceae bacterium]|nr:T9SS type B sorting domain-containing protein [Flavobacteriaceae bacterium]
MKKIVLIFSLLVWAHSWAQNQAANWYFGEGAGINFNLASGEVTSLDDGRLNTLEGCTSISDSNGKLLLYTDGTTVYNQEHQIMQNGTGLYGDSSSTQSALVVPQPGNSDIYFIFTVDVNVFGQGGTDFGFNYSIVDMRLDGGKGAITSKNINLLENCSEKISGVLKDCQTDSIWVITLATEDGTPGRFTTYHAFEVSTAGVDTNAVKSTFPPNTVPPDPQDRRGQLKVSPDGTKVISANMFGGLYLFDFDPNTGILSNQLPLIINSISALAYGVEFSPNSELLYVHSSNPAGAFDPANRHQSSLTQFDLTASDIQASEYRVDQRQLYRGSLQLGPNGKIYRTMSDNYFIGQPYLSVINNPNALGAACNYENNAINLSPNKSTQGLPPFVQSFFNDQIDIIQNGTSTTALSLCTGENYTLSYQDIPGAIYTWYKDDILLPETDFDLVISENGTYELLIEFTDGTCDTYEGIAYVTFFEIPVANPTNDIVICDDNNDGLWNFDLSEQDATIIGTQVDVRVRYFESQLDADTDQNEIIGPFENNSTLHIIYARAESIGNPDCYDTTSFNISVFNSPVANSIPNIELCDNNLDGDDTNGQVELDLSALISDVLGNQNSSDYDVSFHSSQTDADTNSTPLPLNYINASLMETIYVRIENNLNVNCYQTSSFNITINLLPVANSINLLQCDEDGTPNGRTIFNLTEAHEAITGGATDVSTSFYNNLSDAESGTNAIDGNMYNNIQNPETVYVQVINDNTNCYRITTLDLEVSVTNANDAILERCDNDGDEDGFFNFDLSDANAIVLNGLPTNVSINYYLNYDDALLETNPLNTTFKNTTAYNQIIYARVENANACYGINEVQLTVFELPNIETEFETNYCLNFHPENISLNAGLLEGSELDYTYLWSTGETTQDININAPGVYTVEVFNANLCSKKRTITILPSNIATFNDIEVIDASSNNTLTVLVTGEGDYEYAIDDINGPYQDSNRFENVAAGIHVVYVRDKNNCGIVDQLVSVIGFPKFFTPNNDGYHDTWQIYGLNSQFQSESIVYIYDRYGKLLKQLNPEGEGWDGTFNGKALPSSDYWFHVTLEDGRVFKSHFTLKR